MIAQPASALLSSNKLSSHLFALFAWWCAELFGAAHITLQPLPPPTSTSPCQSENPTQSLLMSYVTFLINSNKQTYWPKP